MDDEIHGASSATPPGESAGVSGWTTTKQAAKVLGVSRRSVQGYVRRGLLEAREEGEGVNKTFFISIDSLNALRNRRNSEASAPNKVAGVSPGSDTAANASANSAEMLRHTIDRLEARTVEATELRIRLELTERTQSSLEEELREERRRREEAEKRAVELERQLEAPPAGPQGSQETHGDPGGVVDTPAATSRPAEGGSGPLWHGADAVPEDPPRRPWWRRWLGG